MKNIYFHSSTSKDEKTLKLDITSFEFQSLQQQENTG